MEEIMENIGEENKEDFLHDLRILYLNIFYPLTLSRKLKGGTSISLTSSSHHFFLCVNWPGSSNCTSKAKIRAN